MTVVDNSQSAAVQRVSEHRGARYVRTDRNLGFAAGVNVALRDAACGEPCDVLLLNPDVVLSTGTIAELQAALAEDGRACAASPALVRLTGEAQGAEWPLPSPGQAWLEALGLARLDRHPRFAVGAVLLLRWEALQEVGLFDERFFLYAEEADWQRRARACGWHTVVRSTVVATHAGGAMSEDSSRRERLFYAAQELYIRKWYGSSGWFLYRLAVIVGAAVRAVLLPRPRRSEAARRLRAYLRGPRRGAAASG